MPWVHVAAQDDAYGAAGWLIVPTRPSPALNQSLMMFVPVQLLRWLPHFGGWWVSADATPGIFQALSRSHLARDMCSECGSDGVPCEEAVAALVERVTRLVQAQEMLAAMRERQRNFSRYTRATGSPFGPSWTERSQPRSAPPIVPPRPSSEELRRSAANTLGVKWPATKGEIQKAFRRAIAKAHTDHGGSDAQAIAVIEARKTLLAAA